MNLKSWIESERGRGIALAKALDVPPSFITKMVSGEKSIPVHHMAAIESFTGGSVTRRDMRPDDFSRIWPELADTTATHLVRAVRSSMDTPTLQGGA